jgi:hypothetical protein
MHGLQNFKFDENIFVYKEDYGDVRGYVHRVRIHYATCVKKSTTTGEICKCGGVGNTVQLNFVCVAWNLMAVIFLLWNEHKEYER